eukprot:COSAG06_NODE_628_length_13649_cov_20.848930_13_plen_308_part_00
MAAVPRSEDLISHMSLGKVRMDDIAKPKPVKATTMEGGAGLPFGGDLNAAMRAQDRAAIRVLMEHRDRVAAAGAPAAASAAAAAAAAAGPPVAAPAAAVAAEPEPHSGGAAALVAPPVTDGPVFNVKVKFGKQVVPLAINVGAGVPPILQQLASLTKVPVSSQTLLGPGGRKWTPSSDLSTLGVKEGMKLTLIGKVPPGWRALDSIAAGEQASSPSPDPAARSHCGIDLHAPFHCVGRPAACLAAAVQPSHHSTTHAWLLCYACCSRRTLGPASAKHVCGGSGSDCRACARGTAHEAAAQTRRRQRW